jgi:hypothetical protein
VLEALCLATYVVDIGLKMYYQSASTFLSYESGKKWQAIYFATVLFLLADFVLPGPALSRRGGEGGLWRSRRDPLLPAGPTGAACSPEILSAAGWANWSHLLP